MRQNWDLAVSSAFLAVIFFLLANSSCFAQGPAPAPATAGNSVVKTDSLEVHSGPDQTSAVVQTLKKGDSLVLGLEIRSTVHTWCSVKLPGQNARLGYVECSNPRITSPAINRAPPQPLTQPADRKKLPLPEKHQGRQFISPWRDPPRNLRANTSASRQW